MRRLNQAESGTRLVVFRRIEKMSDKTSSGIVLTLDLEAAKRGFEAREKLRNQSIEDDKAQKGSSSRKEFYPQQEKGRLLDILA